MFKRLRFALPLHEIVAYNVTRPCTAKWCDRTRVGAGRYCASHRHRLVRFGHPQGRRLQSTWNARRVADRFLKRHASDPTVRSALGHVAGLLADRRLHSRPDEYGRLLRRLAGYPARDAVVRLLAVWIVVERLALPDDVRLEFHLAHCLLHLRARPGHVPRAVAGELGAWLRERLAPLMALWLWRVRAPFEETDTRRRREREKKRRYRARKRAGAEHVGAEGDTGVDS